MYRFIRESDHTKQEVAQVANRRITTLAKTYKMKPEGLLEKLIEAGIIAGGTSINAVADEDRVKSLLETPSAPVRSSVRSKRRERRKVPSPQDKRTMDEINAWARVNRDAYSGQVPDKWDQAGKGKIRYYFGDQTGVMPAMEFETAVENRGPWDISIPYEDKLKQAEKLETVNFNGEVCELCGGPQDEYRPELAMVHSLLHGGVLVAPGYRPNKAVDEFPVEFRRVNLVCRLWEQRMAGLLAANSGGSLDGIQSQLNKLADEVHAEAKKKQPDLTRLDVLESLKRIRAYQRQTHQGEGA